MFKPLFHFSFLEKLIHKLIREQLHSPFLPLLLQLPPALLEQKQYTAPAFTVLAVKNNNAVHKKTTLSIWAFTKGIRLFRI